LILNKKILGGKRMQISFCGAAQTVTGSCYHIQTAGSQFIVDCGMYQGNKEIRSLNRQNFLFNPAAVDFVLLTHAHIDHSGLLPKLCKAGFKNRIYTTKATVDLCKIALPDSGHIQELEAEWRSRKYERRGLPAEEPLYTAAEATACLTRFHGVNYDEMIEPAPGIKVRFRDAGHIMGSALIEVWVEEAGTITKVVFSGDLGQKNQPIIKDPTLVRETDYLLIESTYGNRFHEENQDKVELLKKIILQSTGGKGNLIIPAFAIGRTQDLLYYIRELLLSGQIPRIPVYIDSPMAISVTEIYRNNPGYYDEPTLEMLAAGNSPFEFPNLHFIRTAEESKVLNATAKGAIIISASGMCDSGRILHHLKHNLWRPESTILFVGYQAESTLGRRLLEGAKVVKVLGEEVEVRAGIHSIGGFSAHADQNGLLEWLRGFESKLRGIFVVHGEIEAQTEFAELLKRNFDAEIRIPGWGERFTLNHAAHQQVKPKAITVSDQLAAYYALDRLVTDLEHSVLNLRNRIHKAELGGTDRELDQMKLLLTELEALLKNQSLREKSS
jgi:metallo-beta-lactamase family protein